MDINIIGAVAFLRKIHFEHKAGLLSYMSQGISGCRKFCGKIFLWYLVVSCGNLWYRVVSCGIVWYLVVSCGVYHNISTTLPHGDEKP